MDSTAEQIRVGQVYREKHAGRNAIVTGFGVSQGDETTIQLTGIGEERWGVEFSISIFRERFDGPLTI